MSFWAGLGKVVGEVASSTVDKVKEFSEEKQQFKDLYAQLDDEELFHKLLQATRFKKIAEGAAIRSTLNERGYTSEQISDHIRRNLR